MTSSFFDAFKMSSQIGSDRPRVDVFWILPNPFDNVFLFHVFPEGIVVIGETSSFTAS